MALAHILQWETADYEAATLGSDGAATVDALGIPGWDKVDRVTRALINLALE